MHTLAALYDHMSPWFEILSAYELTLTVLIALSLDACLGEAKKYHYLVGFGWLAQHVEKKLNGEHPQQLAIPFSRYKAFKGAIAWTLLVLPLPVLYFYFLNDFIWYGQVALDAIILYLAMGLNSLNKHALQVYYPLQEGNLVKARHYTGYLVSRETHQLTPEEMSRATIESMLENGHDSVIASLLYYLIGGAPLVILHRFANTLDAMWGYKTPRFAAFGYASARLDDLLGFFTGKCCTLLYAIQGRFLLSLKNAYQQGNRYKSHNGGWVMAAGATVMKRALGGQANYHGAMVSSVLLGQGKSVNVADIPASIKVVRRAALILLFLVLIMQTFHYLLYS